MSDVVKQAVESIRARFSDLEWLTMGANQQTSLIYAEIRRLDLERAAARSDGDGGMVGRSRPPAGAAPERVP